MGVQSGSSASCPAFEPPAERFDVLRDQDRPTRLVTYEAFVTAAAMEAHKEQPWNLAGINRQGTFRVLK